MLLVDRSGKWSFHSEFSPFTTEVLFSLTTLIPPIRFSNYGNRFIRINPASHHPPPLSPSRRQLGISWIKPAAPVRPRASIKSPVVSSIMVFIARFNGNGRSSKSSNAVPSIGHWLPSTKNTAKVQWKAFKVRVEPLKWIFFFRLGVQLETDVRSIHLQNLSIRECYNKDAHRVLLNVTSFTWLWKLISL